MSVKKPPVRILIVDDFKPWLNLLMGVFHKESDMHIVGTALDGPEAVAKARDLQPDVVLMDMNLETLNGIEAGRQIKRLLPTAMIIFVSGQSEPDIVKSALRACGAGYINKSDVGSELLPAVRAVLQGKSYVSRHCRVPI